MDEEKVVVDQQMLDENPVLKEAGVEVGAEGIPATPEQEAQLNTQSEGKPVGMATIVEDAPAEQFPAHEPEVQ